MTKSDYFKWAINSKLLGVLEWVYSMFTIVTHSTKYIKYTDGNISVIIDNADVAIKVSRSGAIFDMHGIVHMEKGDISNIFESTTTTYGKVLLNYIAFVKPFGNKIPYRNEKMIALKRIHEETILQMLSETSSDTTISVDEYISFGLSMSFLRSLSEVFVTSSTEKGILPPSGIDEFKSKLRKKYLKEYGPDAFKKRHIISMYDSELRKFDLNWLGDDPSLGISLDKKILNNSRKKRFLSVGDEPGITNKRNPEEIPGSLLDGYPKTKDKIAASFNASRAGSYYRGMRTQESGVISDKLIRGMIGFRVNVEDCKTKRWVDLKVTKNNRVSLNGREHFISGVSTVITMYDTILNTTIKLRSITECLAPGISYCKRCAGVSASVNENSMLLVSQDGGARAMKANLKKMHDATTNTMIIRIDDIFKYV